MHNSTLQHRHTLVRIIIIIIIISQYRLEMREKPNDRRTMHGFLIIAEVAWVVKSDLSKWKRKKKSWSNLH